MLVMWSLSAVEWETKRDGIESENQQQASLVLSYSLLPLSQRTVRESTAVLQQ